MVALPAYMTSALAKAKGSYAHSALNVAKGAISGAAKMTGQVSQWWPLNRLQSIFLPPWCCSIRIMAKIMLLMSLNLINQELNLVFGEAMHQRSRVCRNIGVGMPMKNSLDMNLDSVNKNKNFYLAGYLLREYRTRKDPSIFSDLNPSRLFHANQKTFFPQLSLELTLQSHKDCS